MGALRPARQEQGMEKMAKIITRSLGIDIGKDFLDVCSLPEGVTARFPNDAKGINALIAWLKPFSPERIVYEATGIYHRLLERMLGDLPQVKLNPCQAKSFSKALGRRAKTDKADACMLARYGLSIEPELRLRKSETSTILMELQTARKALVKQRTALKNRKQVWTLPMLKRINNRTLKRIEADIEAIDAECRKILQRDDDLRRRVEIVESIPGIGETTAVALLASMPELGTLSNKQVASLAGLAPVDRQSGRWTGKSFIQGGRKMVRDALFMPALVAVRFNPDLKKQYQAFIERKKQPKLAIVAAMRKLIVYANSLIRQNRIWAEKAP